MNLDMHRIVDILAHNAWVFMRLTGFMLTAPVLSNPLVPARVRIVLLLALDNLGFQVFPSQTNFILARPPAFSAQAWLQKLRDRKILVRWFSHLSVRDYLRITIGTPGEAAALVRAARAVLRVGRD